MAYIGTKPADKPLTSADITDGIITSAKIVDGTIVNADINASAAIAGTKLSGAGKVLQVVNATIETSFSTTSTSYVSTSFSVSITPSSASNKILLQLCGQFDPVSSSNQGMRATFFRGATNIGNTEGIFMTRGVTSRTLLGGYLLALDSPSTTSSTTYTLHINSEAGQTVHFNNVLLKSTFIAMEIAA
jgi:hypothetical protein